MRWRRNADEESRRRQRAALSDPAMINAVVADKIRTGQAAEITLGELAGMNAREVVQAIPSDLWSAVLAKIGGAQRREVIPVQLGPVEVGIGIRNAFSYPGIFLMAKGYSWAPDHPLTVLEYADEDDGPLQLMAFGNPFDEDGAPTHYLQFTPWDQEVQDRWDRRSGFPHGAGEEVWDARSILGNP